MTLSSEGSKTDLASIWGSQSSEISSPPSSPRVGFSSPSIKNGSPFSKNYPTLFSVLNQSIQKSPKKTLYVPPRVDSPSPKKIKPKVADYMYSKIQLTSSENPVFDEIYTNSKTYVFRGTENQEYAWDDFKHVVREAKQSVVATLNLVFNFRRNTVRAKALTSSAQVKLDKISDGDMHIDIDKAIELLDDLSKSEKLCIYSTSMFNYSIVMPMKIDHTEMGSSMGTLHRNTISGFIFPYMFEGILKSYTDVNSVKKHNVVLH